MSRASVLLWLFLGMNGNGGALQNFCSSMHVIQTEIVHFIAVTKIQHAQHCTSSVVGHHDGETLLLTSCASWPTLARYAADLPACEAYEYALKFARLRSGLHGPFLGTSSSNG